MPDTKIASQSFSSTADKPVVYFFLAAFAAIPYFFLIYAVYNGETLTTGFLIFSLLPIGILTIGVIFFLDTSDLLVDESGLARRICGNVRMHVHWTDIQDIRQIFRTNVRNGPQAIIQVTPKFRRGILLRLRRMLVISDKIEGFDELIEILNARIARYSIRVEIKSNGVWRQHSKLDNTAT
jgi:hypothetical protein